MSYEEFLNTTLNTQKTPTSPKPVRTAAEIEAELMQFVEMDRKKGG